MVFLQTATAVEGEQRMQKTAQSYSSGEWLVRAGSEEEFVDRWNAFIEWTKDNAAGAESFVLVKSTEEPRRFLSLGSWESQEAQQAWREMPRMQELLDQCRELCQEFDFHTYALAASSEEGPLGAVTDTVGGVTEPVSGVTDTLSGTTDRLLGGGGKEEQR
jgi:heme-degrading monooxygenase HmoA